MSDKLPGFLNPEKKVALPVGGGDFAPSGFIGLTYAQVLYTFMSQVDSKNGEYESLPQYEMRAQAGTWGFTYYYKTQAAAQVAMEMLGVEGYNGKAPRANQTWAFRIDRDSVMNFADAEKLAKWSNPILLEATISTLQSNKNRHELHMLALPLAVQAMAKLLGYDHAEFSINELLRKPEDMNYTDEFQREMIGMEKDFKDSVLWQRRAALWASLGENNPDVYNPIGAEKFATTSEKLSNCLQILASEWDSQAYARVITIPDPRADAKSSNDKRLTIPALYEIFPNKVAAQEAAKLDLERMNKSTASNGTNGTSGKVAMPAAWVEAGYEESDWQSTVGSLRDRFQSKPAKPAMVKLIKELDNTVTEAELAAVWG